MVSIYKLATFSIILQLMIMAASVIQYDPTVSIEDSISNTVEHMDQHHQDYDAEEEVTSENAGILGTIGNALVWGLIIFKTVLKSLLPLHKLFPASGIIETTVMAVVDLFRILLNTVIVIKAYNLFKNKDTR